MRTGHNSSALRPCSSARVDSKAARLRGWLENVEGRVFGRKAGFGHRVTPLPSGCHCRQSVPTDKACNSPTRFVDVMARRKAVFIESQLSSVVCKGSNGAAQSARSTRRRSHWGTCLRCGGLSRRAPLRNRVTRVWDPKVLPSIRTCPAEMAAAYTLMVEGVSPRSRSDCKNCSTAGRGQCAGSCPRAWHHSVNIFHLFA